MKTGFAIGLVLLCAQAALVRAILPDYYVDVGSAGCCLVELNTELTSHNPRIFLDTTFPADGKVSAWEFFASAAGVVYLSAWRINTATEGADELIFLGKNRLEALAPGLQRFEIPIPDRILVEQGDAVGFHFGETESPPILRLETDMADRTLHNTMSRVHVFDVDLRDPDMVVGFRVNATDHLLDQLSPIKGFIASLSPNLKLHNGKRPNQGLALMFRTGTWGYICDKWFENLGWPLLFCLEMGFPLLDSYEKDVEAKWVKNPRLDVDGLMPAHQESPRCKVSDNIRIFNCEIHEPNGACDREMAVEVTCSKRVQFVNVGRKNTGIPIFYDGHFWGTICDAIRTPKWHMENQNMSWTKVFCIEGGYDYAVDVQYAIEHNPNYTPMYPVGRRNPTCERVNPNRMEDCPQDRTNILCDSSHNLFVECYKEVKRLHPRDEDEDEGEDEDEVEP